MSVCNCKKRERRRGRHFGLCVRLLSCFVGVQTLAHLTTPPLKRGPPLLLVQQQQQQHITYNWPSASDQERGELSFPHTTVSLSWQRPLVFFTIMADRRHSKKICGNFSPNLIKSTWSATLTLAHFLPSFYNPTRVETRSTLHDFFSPSGLTFADAFISQMRDLMAQSSFIELCCKNLFVFM